MQQSRLYPAILALGLMWQPHLGIAATESLSGNETLESKVEQRVRMDGRIRWDDLRVEAHNGLVTLYGIVKSNEESGFAEKAASTVAGVSRIDNKLIVQPAMPDAGHDSGAQIREKSGANTIEGPEGLRERQIVP